LKRKNEKWISFADRILSAKNNEIIDLDKTEIYELLFGEKLSSDEARKRLYSVRKIIDIINNENFANIVDTDILSEFEIKKLEIQKEKIKLQDVKTELNKVIRTTARYETLSNIITDAVNNSDLKDFEYKPCKIDYTDNDLLICLNDIHNGIDCKNFWNNYNPEILKVRLNNYLSNILQKKDIHNSYGVYVFLGGDQTTGIIHNSLRLESTQNAIEQIMYVSELVGNFIYELSKHFAFVRVCNVSGNHSRLFKDKDCAVKGERTDSIIPWYLKARLQNLENVTIVDNSIDDTIGTIDIRGKLYYFVHGEYDSPSKVNQTLTMMLGVKPDVILMAHRHHFACENVFDTKVIMSGSMMGTDSYAIENRLVGKATQTVCVCNKNGIDAMYDIVLN